MMQKVLIIIVGIPIKSNKTVELKKKGNVAGITYYFKVRSYKKVGNKKVRGNFSKVQAVYISR